MRSRIVALPDEDWIDTFDLTRLIALELTSPPPLQLGVAAIARKLVPIPNYDFKQRAELTDSDREIVEKILLDLPPLHSRMGIQECADFQQQWRSHRLAPSWDLDLPQVTGTTVNASQVSDVQAKHLDQLGRRMQSGSLTAFDRHLVEIPLVGLGYVVRRQDALSYLQSIGCEGNFCKNPYAQYQTQAVVPRVAWKPDVQELRSPSSAVPSSETEHELQVTNLNASVCQRQCNRDQQCQSNIDQGLELVPVGASCG